MAATLPLPEPSHPLDIEISDVHRLADYKPPEWDIEKVELLFDIVDETRVGVRAIMRVRRANLEDGTGERPLLVLNKGPHPVVHRVTINGEEIPAERIFVGPKAVVIQPDSDDFTLTTEVTLDPSTNKSNQGLFVTSKIIVSQCEAASFSDITPFVDRPDMMTRWTTTVTAPQADYPVTLSNGNRVNASQERVTHTQTFENPFKMPPHLFALVAGKLKKIEDTYTTMSGRTVKLEIYAAPQFIDGCTLAMATLKQALKWEEERWGVECDLDEYKIAVVEDFNAGAMENKGLNVFSAGNAVGTQKNRTDAALLGIMGVIAHELGHNVRGNRVGIRTFHEIALKEGFTRWTDQQFQEDVIGPQVRIEKVKFLRGKQFSQDAGSEAHPVLVREYTGDPMVAQMYSATAYEKGAEVVNMLHTMLGEEKFKTGFQNYLKKFDGKAVTLYDLIRAVAEPSGLDVTQFERWLDQVGTPEVEIEKHYDPKTKTLSVTFKQSCPRPPHDPLHMPCAFAIWGPDGKPLPLEGDAKGGILHLKKSEETFVFKNVPRGSVPSFFRGFSAPIKVRSNETITDRMHLMKHETDAFNKVEACETVLKKGLQKMMEEYRKGKKVGLTPKKEVFDILGYVLEHAEDNLALTPLMLTPPEIMNFIGDSEVYDFEAACAALDAFKKAVAKRFEKQLWGLYQKYKPSSQKDLFDEKGLHPEVAHERSLKNVALSYLATLGDPYIRVTKDQFEHATNMSDEQTALLMLSQNDAERDEALKAFHKKWKKDPLAMEQWLWAQGLVDSPDVLQRIKKITESKAFDLSKPKHVFRLLVRGLIDNHRHVHRLVEKEGGEKVAPCYTFIADKIIACPSPYWATRMTEELFSSLPKMDAERQALMRKELERIASAPDIKNDTRNKALSILGAKAL